MAKMTINDWIKASKSKYKTGDRVKALENERFYKGTVKGIYEHFIVVIFDIGYARSYISRYTQRQGYRRVKMNRIKLMLNVVENLRELADSLQLIVDVMADGAKTDDANAQASETGQVMELTLEDMRRLLAQKSKSGYSSEVKALISKYGADKLSGVDPSKYPKMFKEAEAIGNGK